MKGGELGRTWGEVDGERELMEKWRVKITKGKFEGERELRERLMLKERKREWCWLRDN